MLLWCILGDIVLTAGCVVLGMIYPLELVAAIMILLSAICIGILFLICVRYFFLKKILTQDDVDIDNGNDQCDSEKRSITKKMHISAYVLLGFIVVSIVWGYILSLFFNRLPVKIFTGVILGINFFVYLALIHFYITVVDLTTYLCSDEDDDEIAYEEEDFQTFRNNLHHRIKDNELECILEIIESDDVSEYIQREDYLKALYLVATVDFISKKNGIPLCDKYSDIRRFQLAEPYYVGDSVFLGTNESKCIEEFVRYNIFEGDLYDAV